MATVIRFLKSDPRSGWSTKGSSAVDARQAALAFLKHPWSADVTAGEELLLNGVDLLKQVAARFHGRTCS